MPSMLEMSQFIEGCKTDICAVCVQPNYLENNAIIKDAYIMSPGAIKIIYDLMQPNNRYNAMYLTDLVAGIVEVGTDELNNDYCLWHWLGIWAFTLQNDHSIKIDCLAILQKAFSLGDVLCGYLYASVTYDSPDFDLSDDAAFEDIYSVLDYNISNNDVESMILKFDILADQDEFEKAKLVALGLADLKNKRGIRRLCRMVDKFYLFLPELKMRIQHRSIQNFILNNPSPEIAQFFQTKNPHSGKCDICMDDENKTIILHDCNVPGHALCVACYCLSASCPQCRFDIVKIKTQLANTVTGPIYQSSYGVHYH